MDLPKLTPKHKQLHTRTYTEPFKTHQQALHTTSQSLRTTSLTKGCVQITQTDAHTAHAPKSPHGL